ncbi:hypothetical protein J9303_11780 [Bacillaceae bacterium Marseille-Q3522]|nr:hypothetical protein [Bacillaceae bacterium Marseille-Q3522]
MEELANCPRCGAVFVKSQFRDLCPDCWREEEEAYETIYHFLRKRENRAATIQQVVKGTGVEESLILKFIRTGRLKITQFPNLGYPCDRCGRIIREGKICKKCAEELRRDLKVAEFEEERKAEIRRQTYLAEKNSEKDNFLK